MIYGNFSTGSLGYQDSTILKINRKVNAERKGPKIPIVSLAVAGPNLPVTISYLDPR